MNIQQSPATGPHLVRKRDPFAEPRAGDIFDCFGMRLHVTEAGSHHIDYYCSDALGRGVGPRRSVPLAVFLLSIGPPAGHCENRATLIYAAR
jgi:hypothetical protein